MRLTRLKSFFLRAEEVSPECQSVSLILPSVKREGMSAETESIYNLALQEDPAAIFKLGLRFYKGIGVAKDVDVSYELFSLLRDEDADAEYYMGEIFRQGLIGSSPDYHQACCHYAAAAMMGNEQSKARLREVAEVSGDEFWANWISDE